MIINLYKHRGYILRSALADVRNRYAGSAAGVLWNILQPLALILVFTLIFTRVMTGRSSPIDGTGGYVLYLCSAMLPWTAFSECINRGTHAFTANSIYLRKLPIPEQVFVAQTAVATGINLAISYSLLIVVALVLGRTPTWHWLLLPIPLGMLIALGFGLGMALGTLYAFVRDVGQVVPVALQIGFWSFPIVYDIGFVPEWLRAAIRWNPVYPSLQAIRTLFLDAQLPEPRLWAGMILWATLASVAGYFILRRLRPELRDVI